ncbi:TPA: hypothetical protein HA246_05505 [Candidatus Woesearchaeota archaeon]|nr:hypothetical protein [Candidatus Woesearchaeota archaeon]
MYKEGPAIQLMNLLSLIIDGKADNLNGTARSLYRKLERLGRKVHVNKLAIETGILDAYLMADEKAEKTCDQPTVSDGTDVPPPAALEQRVGTVEYAR